MGGLETFTGLKFKLYRVNDFIPAEDSGEVLC